MYFDLCTLFVWARKRQTEFYALSRYHCKSLLILTFNISVHFLLLLAFLNGFHFNNNNKLDLQLIWTISIRHALNSIDE